MIAHQIELTEEAVEQINRDLSRALDIAAACMGRLSVLERALREQRSINTKIEADIDFNAETYTATIQIIHRDDEANPLLDPDGSSQIH